MTDQLALVAVAAKTILTPRQQQAFDHICSVPGGVTADEIGAYLHSTRERRPHDVDQRCTWCAKDGLNVCRSRGLKALVVRRQNTGKYEARLPEDRASEPTVQKAELAGDTFEDLFAA